MTNPDGSEFGGDAPEADVAEQLIPVDDSDEDDTWHEAARITTSRGWDASEADLIEQAIAVPDDDRDFDR
jgi:hypothetical protein